jgi:uridine monophosphate synthetase
VKRRGLILKNVCWWGYGRRIPGRSFSLTVEKVNFLDKLNNAVERNQSLLCVGLDPNPEILPARYSSMKTNRGLLDGLDEWLQYLIAQTKDLVCAYKPTLEFYRALGPPGLELLRKTLGSIPIHIPIILDAKHGDLETATVFAGTVFLNGRVDAVTLIPYAGQDQVAPFLVYLEKAVFILCTTANPSASVVQEYPTSESPLYLQIAKEAKTWGTPEQLAFEVGAVVPEVLARIRKIAPERIILAPTIWADDSNLAQILAAGLTASGDGLILPVPQNLLNSEDPAESIKVLREVINHERHQIVSGNPACSVWMSNVCFLDKQSHRDLILQLYDLGCITFGDHIKASGKTVPYYIDLCKIISTPQIFHQILSAYADILRDLEFERIAGIPYGALPIATGLALRLGCPMIFPRKEVKSYAGRRLIEGNYREGETVVVIDDILITGKSVMEGAEKLKSVGLKVYDLVVFIDHQQEGKDRLQENGYRGHAVLTISEIAETLHDAGRLTEEQFKALTEEKNVSAQQIQN